MVKAFCETKVKKLFNYLLRGDFTFTFNFSPTTSFTDYGFETDSEKYKVVLNTDNNRFGGANLNDDTMTHQTQLKNGVNRLKLYLPSRSAMVLKRIM